MNENRTRTNTETTREAASESAGAARASTSPASPTTTRAACTAPGSTPPRDEESWSARQGDAARARPHPELRSGRSTTTRASACYDLDEFESFETVARIAAGIAEHGPAFAAWAAHVGVDSDQFDEFEDVYMGEWESGASFRRGDARGPGADRGDSCEACRSTSLPYVDDRLRGLLRRPRLWRRDHRCGEARWRHLCLPQLVRILVVELSTNDASAHRYVVELILKSRWERETKRENGET